MKSLHWSVNLRCELPKFRATSFTRLSAGHRPFIASPTSCSIGAVFIGLIMDWVYSIEWFMIRLRCLRSILVKEGRSNYKITFLRSRWCPWNPPAVAQDLSLLTKPNVYKCIARRKKIKYIKPEFKNLICSTTSAECVQQECACDTNCRMHLQQFSW